MSRTLTEVLGNSQKLDGGAMFGNAPRVLWSRWMPADELHRIQTACRAMLVREKDGRTVLCETGIGVFFPPDLRDRYGVIEPEHVLLRSLGELGLSHEDIDVVVLSHLHFDHAGGLLSAWSPDKPEPDLLFPNATFVIGREAWDRATHPHSRDRASFIPGLVDKLAATGRVELVDGATSTTLGEGWTFHKSDGHTPGLMLAEVAMPGGPVVFAADLIPGRPWVHLPITMGYDRFPEKLIDEKEALLTDLVARGGRLFFTHDPEVALARVSRDPKGKFVPVDEVAHPTALAA
jgi:glyoxylase-like metal-dependent hydrolase (beta-lactamase superfamily II)